MMSVVWNADIHVLRYMALKNVFMIYSDSLRCYCTGKRPEFYALSECDGR